MRAALALLTAIARIMAHHSSADNAEITLGSGLTEVRLVVLVFWIAKYSRIAIHAGAATPVILQSCELLAGGDVYVLRVETRSLG